ncbi:hypothetical protein KQI86_08600 [Clostridium sp. MSJ-11]|uniref:DUF7000 domain-containing protein n=1 Tax=Clostridium mobile TaxID=2841512 RepID=A0ABS6EHA4_9CLOT|nr:hypothetical protein [Clostridium mobile]MBU5484385.1 hypothetical protein [Clostridium mobile]
MESLSKSLSEYVKLLQETNLQKAYKGLIEYISELRKHFKENFSEYEVSGSLYQGYLDLTFFTLTTKEMKLKELKFAIVFIHDKMQFEVWLSGKNRAVMSSYHKKFSNYQLDNYTLAEDEKGMDSIIEAVLVDKPNFDNLIELTNEIEIGVINFIKDIENLIN